jgi:hypothetical protein
LGVLVTVLLPSAPAIGQARDVANPGSAPVADAPAVSLPAGVATDWWSAVQKEIRQSEYHITWQEQTALPGAASAYQAPNRAQGLRSYFTAAGPAIVSLTDPDVWRLDLRLAALLGMAGLASASRNAAPAAPPAVPLAAPCQAGSAYQPACDLDHDGDVDITDIQLAASHWGQSGPYVETSWQLTGNPTTVPGTNFLGTTDNQALELRVNGQRALRLEPSATSPNLIGGFAGNTVDAGVYGATIGGGGYTDAGACPPGYPQPCQNRVTNNLGTVGGGTGNIAGQYATVGGGEGNRASGVWATVGGGYGNNASSERTTIGGGYDNDAAGERATIGGGQLNTAAGDRATIGGGYDNDASGDRATIGGGEDNRAAGELSTVGGGWNDRAVAAYATVGGGYGNLASGDGATVAGGYGNVASGLYATVGGGYGNNPAGGLYATMPGGYYNKAEGNFSFAAGAWARALHSGSFVWADATGAALASQADNQFRARASGGVVFNTNAAATTGAYLAAGGGSWATLSDRGLKANFAAVDGRNLLERLAGVPVTTWNYKSQDAAIRHIGPMAQDFYAAFGVGEDDTHITTVDADGVALAAIQGLYEQNKALEAENAQLKAQLGSLADRVTALELSTATRTDLAAWPRSTGLLLLGLSLPAGLIWAARRRRLP